MEARATRIIDYFSEFKQYLVPLFQRPYTWGEKHWRNLWDDIVAFYDYPPEKDSVHFMGAVVTMPARSVPVGVSKFMLIDGQQRLTTMAVLLCAIRDTLSEEQAASQRRIQNHFLTNDGCEGLDFYKILPTQADREPYCQLIRDGAKVTAPSKFRSAYDYFCRQLKGTNSDGNALEPKRILDIIEHRLNGVMINLSDADDPHLIFESLNFKGAPLEQADLVRNYFLMRFPVADQQQVYDDLWRPMEARLGDSLTEFMRHFLGSEGAEVRKGDVYAAIKRLVANQEESSVFVLMTRMARLSEFYRRIAIAPGPESQIGSYLVRFKRLDFGTVYPLLLSLYDDYEDEQFSASEFLETLRILESYIVRRLVVGVPSASLSDVFISLCRNKPLTDSPAAWLSASLVRETKNRRWPTDAEFHQAWLTAPIYMRRLCPVVLQRLEEHFGHKERADVAESSIEHVMPQTLTPEWEIDLGPNALQIHERWLHSIGNLTITGYNPELSNKSYAEKRLIYANSHYDLNQYFQSVEVWGAHEIQSRAEALFKTAVDLWPKPAETIQPPGKPQPAPGKIRANFYGECIALAQAHLGISLSKISRTRYRTGGDETRVLCTVSALHRENEANPYFWFGLHQDQIDFLEGAAEGGWLCLGCGAARETLLIPIGFVTPLLEQLSDTEEERRHYWHLIIHPRDGRLIMRFLEGVDGPDLSQFLLPTGERE